VRVAYLVSGDVGVAHEAASATWSIAWRKLRSVRDDQHVRAWLAAVAGNEARQVLRRQRRHTVREISLDAFAEEPPSGATPIDRDANLDLMAALRGLDPQDRSIVAMRYALGLSSFEIARATGLSAPGVRSRLQRSLERLRKELSDE
jgi:RNA polymerase sigma-70 factor, ECF subfamily